MARRHVQDIWILWRWFGSQVMIYISTDSYNHLINCWGTRKLFFTFENLVLAPPQKKTNYGMFWLLIMGFDKLVELYLLMVYLHCYFSFSSWKRQNLLLKSPNCFKYQTVPGPLLKSSWRVSKTADIVISTMSEGRFHSSLIRNPKFAY